MKKFKLQSVGIEVTWNCNQQCSYCYLACDKNANSAKKNMTAGLFEEILDKIWDAGIRDVYLIGGEPTLHHEFGEIVQVVGSYKWKRKGICTNGVGLSSETIDLISKSFDYVSMSVRGTESTTSKITKNKKSFQDTMAVLRAFSKSKIEIRIEIDLLPEYFNEFRKILKTLEGNKINFKFVDIHRIMPIGKAKTKDVASISKYKALLKTIDIVSKKKKYSIKFEDSFPLCLFEKKYWKYINICQCGTSKIWIDPHGMARRCACSSGAIGNVKKHSLFDIWNSKIMSKFHLFQWVDKECEKCKVFGKCLGGCPSSRGVKFFDKDIFSDSIKAIK
ncbi:MAG: radical SAM protein [Parcubacteria group bacterium]